MSSAWTSDASLSFRSGKRRLTLHSAMHRPKWSLASDQTEEPPRRRRSNISPAAACNRSRHPMLLRRTGRTNPASSPSMAKGMQGTRLGRRSRPAFCASLGVNSERSSQISIPGTGGGRVKGWDQNRTRHGPNHRVCLMWKGGYKPCPCFGEESLSWMEV